MRDLSGSVKGRGSKRIQACVPALALRSDVAGGSSGSVPAIDGAIDSEALWGRRRAA